MVYHGEKIFISIRSNIIWKQDIICLISLFWHWTIYMFYHNIFPWLRSSYFSYLSFKVKITDIFEHIIPSIPSVQYFSISRINFQMWSMLCMSFVYYFICSPYFWYVGYRGWLLPFHSSVPSLIPFPHFW